jgi:hypothetical protein
MYSIYSVLKCFSSACKFIYVISFLSFEEFKIGLQNKPILKYKTSMGRSYQVEVSEKLNPPDWQALGTAIQGDGLIKSIEDLSDIEAHSKRFYRIKVSH